jgi:hypothetical protein
LESVQRQMVDYLGKNELACIHAKPPLLICPAGGYKGISRKISNRKQVSSLIYPLILIS